MQTSRSLAEMQELALLAASDPALVAICREHSPNPASERAKYAGYSQLESKNAHALAKIRRDHGTEAFDGVVERTKAETWPVSRLFVIHIFRQLLAEASAIERCSKILDKCPRELVERVHKTQMPGTSLLDLSEKLQQLSVQLAMMAAKSAGPLPR